MDPGLRRGDDVSDELCCRFFQRQEWTFLGITSFDLHLIKDDVMKQPCVYILASQPRGTLYTGVTSDLTQRVWQHKQHLVVGFTQRYAVSMLVWYEVHDEMQSALQREKHIKEWRRQWKIELIEAGNPTWCDLYTGIANWR
jgi:putative endonuclease